MIFQNPRMALNPIRKVGDQIEDVLKRHAQATSAEAGEKAIQALEQVRIARPRERYHAYPFELSGGMCQRVVIALALACDPQLLIADEPTTGLDVTTQKAVMDLVTELTRQRGMSTILITHDLGLAAAYCDRVIVMRQGEVVETASRRSDLPPTRARLHAQADAGDAAAGDEPARPVAGRRSSNGEARPMTSAAGKMLLSVEKLVKEYPRKGAGATLRKLFRRGPPVETEMFRAVDGISFQIRRGESVGLVGKSGCGKSTTSMMVMRLLDQTSGRIVFDGENIGEIPSKSFARLPLAQTHPDGVPGSDRQPQSAFHRGARHRRPDPAAW